MTDDGVTVGQLRAIVRDFVVARDWEQYHSPRNCAMALSVEANELLELYLWAKDEGPQPPVESRRAKVGEEAADVLITLLNFCNAAGIDLAAAVEDKMRKNGEKYPVERAKGRLEKSTEL